MEVKNHWKNFIFIFITVVFFLTIYRFQFWFEPFANYPHTDEYQSLLKALGYNTYSENLHVNFLKLFTYFAPDFFSLYFLNFIASHITLALAFFWYHWKRGVQFATNLFFTSILVLSTINIALTRKMHFWAAAFYFLIMGIAVNLDNKKRNIFLIFAFIILGFFRVEFAFAAAVALGLGVADYYKNRKVYLWIGISFLGMVLACFLILTFAYGMKDLLIESLKLDVHTNVIIILWNWIRLFCFNVMYHGYYSLYAFATTLRIYFPTLTIAFLVLFFIRRSSQQNFSNFFEVFKKDFLFFYLPALLVLWLVRFMDFYVIMSFVLFLSCLCFLFNSKENLLYSLLIFALILPAFYLKRPNLSNEVYLNFPNYKRHGKVHRLMVDLIRKLPEGNFGEPYKILFDQDVKGVLSSEGREFYLNRDLFRLCQQGQPRFDVALLVGDWYPEPHPFKEIVKNCVLPGLTHHRQIKIAPGYLLYVSDRVPLDKSDLK